MNTPTTLEYRRQARKRFRTRAAADRFSFRCPLSPLGNGAHTAPAGFLRVGRSHLAEVAAVRAWVQH